MFIKKVKINSNGKHMISLVESYRDKDGKPKHRTIKKYGILEDLQVDNPNILEELQLEAKQLTEAEEKTQTITIDFTKLQEKSMLNYGYVFLASIYNQLKINQFIKSYQTKKRSQYDLDHILKLLIFSRILNPSSKRRSFQTKSQYFHDFNDIKLEDIYKSLDDFSSIKDELTYHLHEVIKETRGRDCSLVFYDVTNYYFESDVLQGLRQKGVSKEKQKTGIVQMGLFIDKEGIPITYELFPGNTNDLSTMKPILEKIKLQYGLGKITVVADKGNNSGDNLAYIDEAKDYYIISQKIRGRGTKLSDLVLDETGYQYNKDGSFKSKKIKRERQIKKEDGSTYTIEEHLLCFWSKKEEAYQKSKRGDLDEKIEKYLEKPSLLNASNSFGVKKYFKKVEIDKETGEVIKTKPKYMFNKEKYERDTALDGYYAIVTNDLSLEVNDIIDSYRQLSKIEDSFKVTKTDLEGRPVYVWTDEHIKGHFLTCYLSLTIIRLIQLKLNNQYSVDQITSALKDALLIELEEGIFKLNKNHDVVHELAKIYEVNIKKSYYKEEVLKKILNSIVYYK